MKELIEKYSIYLAIVTVFVLILTGASLSFYNTTIMDNALKVQAQAEFIKREATMPFENIQAMDISSRGYAVMGERKYVVMDLEQAERTNQRNFHMLDSLYLQTGYFEHEDYQLLKKMYGDYIQIYKKMLKHLDNGEVEEYKAILATDPGYDLWVLDRKFSKMVVAHQEKLNQEAQAAYTAADYRNTWLQVLLLVIGLPTLAGVMWKMRNEASERKTLLLKLEENNHKYLFNDGENRAKDSKKILESSIENLKKAAEFVNQITEGNYEAKWEQLNEQNLELNQQNLAGRLVLMREQMKKVRQEDEKRLWATEGLSKFSEVIRTNQHNLSELCNRSLQFLVKYLKAQQGSLFVVEKAEDEEPYLQLAACYAFNRKKHISKRIEIGEGLLGQAYLEGDSIFLTDVPQAYTSITSGLGDATPKCILIIPLKYNQEVQAIIELASFQVYQPHEVTLLEKAGEFIASAIATALTNEKTNKLLAQLQIQTEQMRAHEEELRQNMEELEATQEEMRRKGVAFEESIQKMKPEGEEYSVLN